MYELKKLERYLRVNLLGPGPRLIKKNLPGRGLTKVEKHCSRERVVQLYPRTLGIHFSRLLQQAWATLGLFLFPATTEETFHEYPSTFTIPSRHILLRMWNVSDKSCTKNVRWSFSKIRVVYEIMSKNMANPDRPQMTIKYGARPFVRCIPKATYRHSEYVIIIAFPLQQRYANVPQYYIYAHIACLVPSDKRNM